MATADPIAALRNDLVAASLPTDRVWSFEMSDAEINVMTQNPRDNIVLIPIGRVPGESDQGYARIGRLRVDVRCYSADARGAMRLYLATHDTLKAMRAHVTDTDDGDVLIHNVTALAGPIALRDPDTDWHFVQGIYGVGYSEQLAS